MRIRPAMLAALACLACTDSAPPVDRDRIVDMGRQFERGRYERPFSVRAAEARAYLAAVDSFPSAAERHVVERARAVVLADSVAQQVKVTLRLAQGPFVPFAVGHAPNPTNVDLRTFVVQVVGAAGDTATVDVGPVEAGMQNKFTAQAAIKLGPVQSIIVLDADTARSL